MTTTKFNKIERDFKNNLQKETIINSIFTILIFATMIIIISSPKTYTDGTISGIKLFFYSVLPGLFPFMLLTKLLTELGFIYKISEKFNGLSNKLFGTPGISLYAFLMSILSGYPIGAKIISDLYNKGQISESQAKKMSVFCTTSGPIFIIGTVGTIMFKSYVLGIIIYISHILSSLILGIIFKYFGKNNANFTKNEDRLRFFNINTKSEKISKTEKNIISTCINETINSLFVVGAYITIFFLLGELLTATKVIPALQFVLSKLLSIFGLDTDLSSGLIYGILEVTRGAKCLSSLGTNASVILVTGLISFSGLSIIFQSMAFLKTAKIKTHEFVFFKLVHSIVSMIICYIFLLLT